MIRIEIIRGHVSLGVAAEMLGVSRQRMHQLLQAGRCPNAILVDHGTKRPMWAIPRTEVEQITDKRKSSRYGK